MPSEAPFLLDCHADTIVKVIDDGADLASNPAGHIDLDRLEQGGVRVQFFAIWVSPEYLPDRCFERAMAMIDTLEEQAAKHADRMRLCRSRSEIEACVAEGKLAACIGIEGGHAIEGDLGKLRALAARGARYMTLTWNNHLDWAESCQRNRGDAPKGLTDFGRDVVHEMHRLGMIVDLSHVSPRTFDDVMRLDLPPPICSHSCARSLREHVRNVDDQRLELLADRGGILGLCLLPSFLAGRVEGASIEDALDHADHILRVGGPGLLALGSDFDGIESVARGLEDVSKLRGFVERIDTGDPVGLAHGNVLRVLQAWE